MKIEIIKKTINDNEIYYWVCIDGVPNECFGTLKEAEDAFIRIKNHAGIKLEVIKSEVIE